MADRQTDDALFVPPFRSDSFLVMYYRTSERVLRYVPMVDGWIDHACYQEVYQYYVRTAASHILRTLHQTVRDRGEEKCLEIREEKSYLSDLFNNPTVLCVLYGRHPRKLVTF